MKFNFGKQKLKKLIDNSVLKKKDSLPPAAISC